MPSDVAPKQARHAPDGWEFDARVVIAFLFVFRIVNALSIKTFFQPDEYFQTLEPAWQVAFGKDSGAWITWVSQCSLPSYLFSRDADLHPQGMERTTPSSCSSMALRSSLSSG